MEGLYVVMSKTCVRGIFHAFKNPQNVTIIAHIFYDDDAISIGD